MAISFPNSPYLGQLFQVGTISFVWNGQSWDSAISGAGQMNQYTVTNSVATITGTGQTVATATFVSNGYPLYISLNGDANPTTSGESYAFVQFYRDGVAIGRYAGNGQGRYATAIGYYAGYTNQLIVTENSLRINLINKLGDNHLESMKSYGDNNYKRLTGIHETSSYDKFSYGVGNRGASIRIPLSRNKTGYSDIVSAKYFEDRRPASDTDPYLIAKSMLSTMFL